MTRPIKTFRQYMGVTILYHPEYHSRFTGTCWRWSAGLGMYASTLAGIKALIKATHNDK